jgi:hypothetical protein
MMPDNIERLHLKQKMLERWENEGGRIEADSVRASQSNLASRQGEGTRAPLRTSARELKLFRLAKGRGLTLGWDAR